MDQTVATLNQIANSTLGPSLADSISRLVVALVILFVGWLVALVVARVVRGLLRRVHLDERLAKATDAAEGEGLPLVSWIGTATFWLILLVAIMGALQALGLTAIVTPINSMVDTVVDFLPKLLGAGILALAAHVLGSIARKLIITVAHSRRLDERLATTSGQDTSLSEPLGDAAYYLVWLFFLPGILGALGLQSLLLPVMGMINQFMSFLPYLAAAAVMLIVGWFAARIVQRVVTGFLASAGVDGFADRIGVSKYMGGMTVSRLLGLISFVVVLIPVVTAALDALNLQSLTEPLTAMMDQVTTAIPSYFAAIAILVITYIVARWLLDIAVEILSGIGLNALPSVLGLSHKDTIGGRTLSRWLGDLALLIVMLLAAVQAAQVIGWTAVTVAIGGLGIQLVQVVIGLVIIAIGLYLANMAGRFVAGSDMPNKAALAMAARVAIIAFAGAMGLTAMGLAEQIVVLAFGLFFGAIAVAVALSFGLGGRDAAARQIDKWSDSLEKDGS